MENYPPTSKIDVILLAKKCGNTMKDHRNKLKVLTDIEYHVVHKNGSGIVKGYSHDRLNPVEEFTLQVKSKSGERKTIPIKDVVKFERIGPIPRKYK